MDVITGWRDVPAQAKGAVLAIGNFDGVHRGHQAVLGRARDLAKETGKRSGAVVFEPHPREFFAPDQPFFRLTPLPVKLELLAALGLDETFVIDFGPELSSLSAETFATEVVAKGLGASHVVVGYDFTYGKGRTGTPAELKALGGKLGFGVDIVEPVANDGVVFSSSKVREHLRKGELEAAAEQLGYWWRVRGASSAAPAAARVSAFPPSIFRLCRARTLPTASTRSAWSTKDAAITAQAMSDRARPSAAVSRCSKSIFSISRAIFMARRSTSSSSPIFAMTRPSPTEKRSPRRCVTTSARSARFCMIEASDPIAHFPLARALSGGTGL